MVIIKLHVLLLIFLSKLMLISTTTLQQKFIMAKPNCRNSCGDISIPFPFGTTENCYGNSSFRVTCDETSNPPKLFFQKSNVEIKEILLNTGQLRVMQYIARSCYDQNGNLVSRNTTNFVLPYLFTVSSLANKFTIVGCDSYGYISGYRWWNRYYSTGCIATCRNTSDLEDGSCMGLGCCQISKIPQDIWLFNLTTNSLNNHTGVGEFNNCTYGFLVEEGAFRFSPDNLTNLWNVSKLPALADWVIGKQTCESAQKNLTTYGCKSQNSECIYIPIGGDGYRCQCKTGYGGNPYLDGGCQDIDECSSPQSGNCTFRCENYSGNFRCVCPKGYLGAGTGERGCYCADGYSDDGIIREGGCTRSIYRPAAGAALGTLLLILVISLVYLELKRRRSEKIRHMFFLRNGGMLLQEKLIAAGRTMSINMEREMSSNNDMGKIFSSTELQHATNNFHNSLIVGQGGFGTVYKGFLGDNRVVAIKKSKEVDPSQIEQFINEVVVLSRVSHRNVVRLLGCCLETEVPLLVYEFINNGTLYDHIHNPDKKCFLDWNTRLKIATETADVLSYLHSAASTPIIHRDVKSANILLDHDFEAKVSDFGASRLVPMDQTQLSTMVQGTFGYLDPEYMQTNQLTEKSDVYSFGVVLLELITGMKPLSYDRPEEERNLTNLFLCRLQQGRLFEVVDETIVCDKGIREHVTEVAKLAQVCLNVRGQDRPSMKEVAMELEGLRIGRKRSWLNYEQNKQQMESFHGEVMVMDEFADVEGCSISIGYDSLRDHTKLSGGR